jgi:two-component system NtrC family sensor kinase
VEESQRISDIVSSLVELARPPRPRPAPVAAGAVLSEAAGGSSGGAPQAAPAKVDIQTAGDLPLLWADRGQIVEVLRELLANAAAAGARRVVLGAAESPQGGVVLSVADDGRGMEPAVLAAAFTPLFSRQPAGRRKGLGLPKARVCVEAHGGRIWIRSEPGRGATVFVHLPAAEVPRGD